MIVVFGSNVLDLFFHTPELPPRDKALFMERHEEAPGGKGANQAVAAARAGAQVYFSGALGTGGHGRQMFENLTSCGVDAAGIRFLPDCPSGLATIFVDDRDGTHRVVVSEGANRLAKQEWIPDHLLNQNTLVLVQGELPIQETGDLLLRAKANNARTMMNFAPATQQLSDAILSHLDFIILNEYEADAVAKQFNMASDDKASFARNLYERFKVSTIVTLGPYGALYAGADGEMALSSLKIKAVDTIGAGDAFVGYFAAGLDQKLSVKDALRQAAVAGSLACTKVGAQTAVPHREEVLKRLPEIVIS
jgi:ribokinase